MKDDIKRIKFDNRKVPRSHFDIIKIEDLLRKDLDHDITKLHRVNFYILLIVTFGQGYHTIDFTDYKYQRGVILTIRKDQIHKFFRTGDTQGYLVIFTEDFIVSLLEENEAQKSLQLFNELLGIPKVKVDQGDFFDISHLVNYIENEYLTVQDEYSSGIIRSLLHVLLTKLYRYKTGENPSILTKKYLQEFLAFQHLVEQKCFSTKTVKDYAEELGFSTKKLNMIVQSIVQKPAKTFIDDILILQIKRLLINSGLSIKEIAYATGFDEPTNLFKYFKRHTGSSPESFRQAHK